MFPGFERRELLRLDIRELELWHEEAERALAEEQLRAIEAASAPHLDEKGRKSVIGNYQQALHEYRKRRPVLLAHWQRQREREWLDNRKAMERFLTGGRK